MTRTFLTASAALASVLALPPAAAKGNEQRAPDQSAEPVNKVQDVAAAATGVASAATAGATLAGYVPNAAMGDMFEIESSTMALGAARTPRSRRRAR
jgi:putative membrane protein